MDQQEAKAGKPPPLENHYVEINLRLNQINGSAAGVITLLTIAAIWGKWQSIGEIMTIQLVVIGFNMWFNLVHLPRRGPSAEPFRAVVNLATSVLGNHLAGWPAPVWLWLPFIALAFDHLDRRVATWTLVAFCVVQDATALLAGVPWIYPLSFTALAVFCSEISRLRFGFIREMLQRSDKQRRELEHTHLSLREAHEQLTAETRAREEAERELRQAQKLEAVGRLAAGVAHEINTPVQFISDSIHFLRDATRDLMLVIAKEQAVGRAVLGEVDARAAAQDASDYQEEADLPYLVENIPQAFDRALDGLSRVATIVRSMKDFAHPDGKEMATVDLNRALESTLTIARNEYKYVAELETSYGDLPPVLCHPGELNQAFLNIIVNAAHAIADVVQQTQVMGRLTARTELDGDHVVISISDTGGGIPDEVRDKIFDPFFTTKALGKGTGQGLSVARAVVTEKHRGHLSFETAPGKGTTFFIRLPIDGGPIDAPEIGAAA